VRAGPSSVEEADEALNTLTAEVGKQDQHALLSRPPARMPRGIL
jgi:hypothetical protein